MYFNFSSLIVMVFVQISLREDVYLSFDGFVLLEKWVYLCARGGEGRGGGSLPFPPSLTLYFGKIRTRGLKHAAHHSRPH